ncbi:hypothetical protein K0M31_017147 [Melipona bicolor]|uniref:Uncharacterized protein n=1 Tax=Melipona bicolor TaxID=60889 RepID=A0AA40FDP4_9HYME|nr:hypothetical protein K0M31_017147 [Melipona bicolor]
MDVEDTISTAEGLRDLRVPNINDTAYRSSRLSDDSRLSRRFASSSVRNENSEQKIVEYKLQQEFVPIGPVSLFDLKVDACLRGIVNTKASPSFAFAFNANISPI